MCIFRRQKLEFLFSFYFIKFLTPAKFCKYFSARNVWNVLLFISWPMINVKDVLFKIPWRFCMIVGRLVLKSLDSDFVAMITDSGGKETSGMLQKSRQENRGLRKRSAQLFGSRWVKPNMESWPQSLNLFDFGKNRLNNVKIILLLIEKLKVNEKKKTISRL